ncbi:hypothetical protein FDH86_gp073 [Arthrobacter phage Tank]|uniref:Uncharacterized protein n=2 Tax=Tankvirus tank TaxID=1982567 RepID=A0A0U4B7C6_9CAUD|nr:hypothetical protein FDH86_gp073 [Arthrobacter phage Tank]ALY10608.1 hypothetical protein TANK_73 [Arthrobacter phage Tank]ALY10891.1 hypothetical protein WILDE_75 [Arthrobacter phage Wilde]
MAGKVVRSVPPARRANHIVKDFDASAELARKSGHPVLAAEGIRITRVNSLRQYTREPYVTDKGRVVITTRNSRVDETDGRKYVDMYFEWQAAESTTKKEN